RQARLWDRDTVDCRLGPTFEQLHPGAAPMLPTAYQPPTITEPKRYLGKDYQLGQWGAPCPKSCDYGSTAGQVLYVPDDPADPGLDRVQTYSYEKASIAESPQAGGWLGGPHPDPGIPAW